MKREHSIACFFCIILVAISLIHLHNYGKCRRRTFDAVQVLRQTERSNQQMHRHVQERMLQLDTLRNISSKAAVHQRHRLQKVQGIKENAYELLHTLHDITKMRDVVQQKQIEEQQQALREQEQALREQEAAKQRAKILPPPIETVRQPDYLLIEPSR